MPKNSSPRQKQNRRNKKSGDGRFFYAVPRRSDSDSLLHSVGDRVSGKIRSYFVGLFRATERDRLLYKKFLVSDYPFASFRYYIDESYQNIKGCETIGCQNRRLSFRKSHCRLWICPCPSFRQNGRGRACGRDCLRNPRFCGKSEKSGRLWGIRMENRRKHFPEIPSEKTAANGYEKMIHEK